MKSYTEAEVKDRKQKTAHGLCPSLAKVSQVEESSDHLWLYLVPVGGGRPQHRRRCNLSAGIDTRGSAVNRCRCLSVRTWIHSGHTMVAGVTSCRAEFGDWVKLRRRDQASGRWVIDDPRLSTSVPSIKDCRKVARLSLERQSRRLGLTSMSAKVIVGLGRW